MIHHLRQLKSSVDIERVIDEVAKTFRCSREFIIGQGKKRNLPRDVAIYLARDLTGESARRLGDYFGNVSGAAITMKYKRMENEYVKEDKAESCEHEWEFWRSWNVCHKCGDTKA